MPAIGERHRRTEDPRRIQRVGVTMLLDRVCVGGGWNSGNSVLYEAASATRRSNDDPTPSKLWKDCFVLDVNQHRLDRMVRHSRQINRASLLQRAQGMRVQTNLFPRNSTTRG